jgi:LmbE family N-acetylglucosaminyl deacetylase
MRTIIFVVCLLPVLSMGQYLTQPDAAKIKLEIEKLNVLGSVLYVAAHPDDENTRIIAALANGRLVETAYLSMTRGDGGQNLIGPEIRDMLGLIRTQELLTARALDGGNQFFTRANDFGFSKSALETFEIWNKQEILSDVVRVFRQFQPDVIITRFPPDERAGHGHHTGSAILAQEAFDAASNPAIFPHQVEEFGVWKPTRLFTNTGRWWNTTINENTPGIVAYNVGGYSPLLGRSFSEIAAVSRSQHKSQGFGSSGSRGDQLEFLEFVKGDEAEGDLLEGIDITWKRVKNSGRVQELVSKVIATYRPETPVASIPQLIELHQAIMTLESGIWKERKLRDVEQIIEDCLGLYAEVSASQYYVAPGQPVTLAFEIVNRSTLPVAVESILCVDLGLDTTINKSMGYNEVVEFKTLKRVSSDKQYSDPYWLSEPHGIGRFTVSDPGMIGKPQNDPSVVVRLALNIAGTKLEITRPVIYKWTDRVKGEQMRPFEVVPPVAVSLLDNVLIFSDNTPKEVKVRIKSLSTSPLSGTVRLALPSGWRCEPATIPFMLADFDAEALERFTVHPGSEEVRSTIQAMVDLEGATFNQSLVTVVYDHIPVQTVLPRAEATLVRVNIKKEGAVIGYIAGAGDEVPAALRVMGYEVWEMKNEEVTPENLNRVDAVVLGIRAINANDRLRFMMDDLLAYVKSGGTMVVQYNTSGGGVDAGTYAPYSLTLSRDRVADEEAEVRFLKPDHAVLNTPNKITEQDFEGWTQERGLYFPNKWDNRFEAVLSMNDKGEEPSDGSLLVTRYGEGYYIYTGLSFFRELPEGVAGAYKLFANIVSSGKPKKPQATKSKNKTR